jgi:predicted ArsR family transcriptional regulator
MDSIDQRLDALTALTDPVRRGLYRFVASRAGEVTRNEAAQSVGISRSLAAYHLDRLVEEGLLEAGFEERAGGPGSGRPAKVYRLSGREVEASIPPRDYRLVAGVLAAALAEAGADLPSAELVRVAREAGRRLAKGLTEEDPTPADLERLLAERGFQPLRSGDEILLRNCPFHALVQEHRPLVCGMNLELMEGVLEALRLPEVRAALEPRPDACCVVFQLPRPASGSPEER